MEYLYRLDSLVGLRAKHPDNHLRARRIRPLRGSEERFFPHYQVEQALANAPAGVGVFRLSMWVSLEAALHEIESAVVLSRVGAGKAWILQRIKANHPFFTFCQRDIDEYLPDRAWLFWTSLPVTEEIDWSPIGIPHADIEIFHHDGHWQHYDQAACLDVRVPEGWTEHSIPSFWGERAFQARLVEVASGRACSGLWLVIRQPGPGLVGRLRPWSEDAQLIIDSLLGTYPMLCEQGRVMITIESEEEVRAVEVQLCRAPPKQSKCSLAERFRELFFRSSRAVYLTPQAGEIELCPSHIVKDVYEAAGIGEAIAGDRKWLYRDNSVEALRSSLAAA